MVVHKIQQEMKFMYWHHGERQTLVFEDSQAEYKAFPTIFSGQTRPSNSEPIQLVHISDLFKAELHNVDPRVALNISNIFYKAKKLQTNHINKEAIYGFMQSSFWVIVVVHVMVHSDL